MDHIGKHMFLGARLVRVVYASPRVGLLDLDTERVSEVERAAFEAWVAEAGICLGDPVAPLSRRDDGARLNDLARRPDPAAP